MGVIRVSGPLCWTLLSSDCYIITATTFVYVWATTWDLRLGIVYIKQTKRTAAQHNGARDKWPTFLDNILIALSWVRMHKLIIISLKFVPKGPFNNISALVQIMAARWPWVRMHKLITISLKFIPKGPVYGLPTLVQIMAWRRPGDKPLSEPVMVSLPTHICITRPQWVNTSGANFLSGMIKVYFVFPIISWHWNGTGSWILSLLKTRTCLCCTVSTMAADALAMQGSRV